jgi:Glyoxalase-like domain
VTLRLVQIAMNARDDSAVGRFWAVPEPKSVKNRVHVDLATTSAAHQADLVARLQDLGATPADVGQGDVPWTCLAEPEGNEFDVLTPR